MTGPLLRDCYLRFIGGTGFQRLARDLNAKGVRSTRDTEIGLQTLIRTMDSGFAAGLLVVNKGADFLPGAHVPLISSDVLEQYRRVRLAKKMLPPKVSAAKWYLAGLVSCGICGARMTVNSYSAVKSQVVCSGYKAGRSCSGMWVNRTTIERAVSIWVGAHVDELAAHSWSDSERGEERTRLERERDAAITALTDAEQSLGNLAKFRATGEIDETGYRLARADLDASLSMATRELADVYAALDTLVPVDADTYERLAAATEGMDTGAWNGLLRRILARVVVDREGFTVQPVVGDPVRIERPPARIPDRSSQVRGANGRFAERP